MKITDNPIWFARFAEQLAELQPDPDGSIEQQARKALAYYHDTIENEIVPACEDEAVSYQPDSIETMIITSTPAEAVIKLRHLVERRSHFHGIAMRFLIETPASCTAARKYMSKVSDHAQATVTRVYELAHLHGLTIEDAVFVGTPVPGSLPGGWPAVPALESSTTTPGIEEPDEDGAHAFIEKRDGCLIKGQITLQPVNINKAFNKLCNDAGIFENTKENRQLFTNMLYNAGGVRIAGHLKVKSRKTTALTYFVSQLEKAVTKLDPACEVTTDKWKVVETWCRDKNGEKFGNNVLAASKSNPRCSNAIDNAVSLLLQKSESSLFSAQRNI